MNQGMLRPSWFNIWQLPPHPAEYDEQGITESIYVIEDLILNQIHSGIDPKRIFLMGFSQGAALSLTVGLTTLNELGGVISLSGWVPAGYRKVGVLTFLSTHVDSDSNPDSTAPEPATTERCEVQVPIRASCEHKCHRQLSAADSHPSR